MARTVRTAVSAMFLAAVLGTVAKLSHRIKDKETDSPLIEFSSISLSLIQFSLVFSSLRAFFSSFRRIPPLDYVA